MCIVTFSNTSEERSPYSLSLLYLTFSIFCHIRPFLTMQVIFPNKPIKVLLHEASPPIAPYLTLLYSSFLDFSQFSRKHRLLFWLVGSHLTRYHSCLCGPPWLPQAACEIICLLFSNVSNHTQRPTQYTSGKIHTHCITHTISHFNVVF